jgi:dTDP-4-dehydrorhamnose reductase
METPEDKPATPRILIIGKRGQVGWELCRTLAPLGEIVSFSSAELKLANPDALRRAVCDSYADIVINAAAYTAVDKAESEPELAMKINGTAPGILAEEARKCGALMVHYSTDYVFDGTKTEPYMESDPTNPLGAYGRSKLAGDEAVRAAGGAHFIFRPCWVYGARGQNFMLTMMHLAREREKLRVVNDQHGCPTWSRMIAEATALALKQTLAAPDVAAQTTGTYHLTSSGATNWHNFARTIIGLMPAEGKKCSQIEAIPSSEYPTPARRPAYSVLSCAKLKRTFGLQLPAWDESLKQVLEQG